MDVTDYAKSKVESLKRALGDSPSKKMIEHALLAMYHCGVADGILEGATEAITNSGASNGRN